MSLYTQMTNEWLGIVEGYRLQLNASALRNENLQARIDELEIDLAFVEDTIAMYEEEEDREFDDLLDAAVDEMLDNAEAANERV